MSLARITSVASRVSSVAAKASVSRLSSVRLAHTLSDRERAAEAAYFNREEEKLLKGLLNKVKAQQTAAAVKEQKDKEMAALNAIVGSKLTDGEKQKLVAWRHSQDF